jgi:hypothetical protein
MGVEIRELVFDFLNMHAQFHMPRVLRDLQLAMNLGLCNSCAAKYLGWRRIW